MRGIDGGADDYLTKPFQMVRAPLVNELNGLLEDRERAVARALATAGDLAHGLKTPLAVLAQEAEQADAAGHHDLAATLRQFVERMQRQVDYRGPDGKQL